MARSPQDPQGPSKMGRPKLFHESVVARLVAGTVERMSAVLEPGEDRSDFVRVAIEREIDRRERERPQAT